MSEFEIKIPDNYEDAVNRKQEVLNMINQYNEALLLDKELPFTDEEIERLQEEYQILNDHLALTKEEKIMRLSEEDVIVNEDGTIEEKVSIFDKIHWLVYVYALVSLIFGTGIFHKKIASATMDKFIDGRFEKAFDNAVDMYSFSKSDMMIKPFEYWARFCLSYLWLPLVVVLVSLIVYFIFRRRKDINTLITKWMLIGYIVLGLVITCLVVFVGENSPFKFSLAFYENIDQYYMYYYYTMSQMYS